MALGTEYVKASLRQEKPPLHEELLNKTPKCVSVFVKYLQLVNVL
jgi:hypothetical protein